jgi:hypothetical protein
MSRPEVTLVSFDTVPGGAPGYPNNLTGPRVRIAVTDSVSWSRAWQYIFGASAAAPRVDFTKMATVIVGSRLWVDGRQQLTVDSVIRTKGRYFIVVRESYTCRASDAGSRPLVALTFAAPGDADIYFVERQADLCR